MKLEDVKKIVNLKELGEAVDSSGLEGFFEEEVDILITELNNDVYRAFRNCDVDDETLDYLEKLKRKIREDLITTIRLYKYGNWEV